VLEWVDMERRGRLKLTEADERKKKRGCADFLEVICDRLGGVLALCLACDVGKSHTFLSAH
jgi:hypothetical protein